MRRFQSAYLMLAAALVLLGFAGFAVAEMPGEPGDRGGPGPGVGRWPDRPGGGTAWRTFFVTWTNNGHDAMFDYIRDARPEVVQVGFYGPMFHGYAHHPESTGYPMRLPVAGETEALARQTQINQQVHALGSKVVGHFQMCNVVGNWEEPFAFVKWYNEHWNEELLGPKPVEDVRELLQRDAEGNVLQRGRYIDFLALCISSPHTQDLLKRMVTVAVNAGVDGLMSNYNYRWGCACHWCQAAFMADLVEKYDADTLRERFGITDPTTHRFTEIPAHIPGYPNPETDSDLHWAAMDWGARHFKQVFDAVLIEHGRSLKPDLIIGTWNHLGLVGEQEERAFTPIDQWHRGEDYFWYSGSHGGSKLADGNAGDAWLNLLWLREMVQGKPFMMGKYEGIRVRSSFAEGSATGGMGTGFYHPFMDPEGVKVITRHLQFIHKHRGLYDDAKPLAEVGLVLPRQTLLTREVEAYAAFREVGQTLAAKQVLFDVVLDERMSDQRLAGYRLIVLPVVRALSDEQIAMLARYTASGGRVMIVGEFADRDHLGKSRGSTPTLSGAVTHAAVTREAIIEALTQQTKDAELSDVDAPWTVRVAASNRPGGHVLHLVNYNRDESATGRGPGAEQPIASPAIPVRLNLSPLTTITGIDVLSPDADPSADPVSLPFEQRGSTITFTVPPVEVYTVVSIYSKSAD